MGKIGPHKKRVVHISTLHARGDGRIFDKECMSLVRDGWEVHLVIADGNGCRSVEGVRIHDIGCRKKSRITRALLNSHQVMRKALSLSPDIIHLHDPELLLSTWIPFFKGNRVVYDIHEDTRTQILLKSYLPRLLRPIISKMFGVFENTISKRMAGLVVPQPTMQERFEKINSRCINLPNYVDLNRYPRAKKSFGRPLLFHAGGLSAERGLGNMVGLADTLGERGEVYVAGQVPKGNSTESLGKLKYLGQLSYDEVLSWYSKANIGMILYNNVGQYHMAGAIKSFEYMASSMPFLMPDFGEWVDFNRAVECGINVDVTDADVVAKAVMSLIDNPAEAERLGRNGRDYVEREFSWQSVSGRLSGLYTEILED